MTNTAQPNLIRSAPYFPVHDLTEATEYYTRKLGFRLDYAGGEPPHFAILSRDGLSLMIRTVASDIEITPNESQGGTWDAFFWARDVVFLHTEFESKGASFAYGMTYQPEYHMDEFAVRDPAGYVLGFGQARSPA